MKNKAQIITTVVILGFVVGAYEFYSFWNDEFPLLRAEASAKEAQVQSLETEARKLQSFAKNIQTIKEEFRELNLQLEAALEHMPRTFNLAALLRKLTMLANNSGVEISVFRPKKDFVKRPDQLDPNKAETKLFYETILVEFSMQGSFTQTLVFFDQLSRLKRIVNVDSVKTVAQRDKDSFKGGSVLASTDVVIKTYRFSE